MKAAPLPTAAACTLKEFLRYDPDSGEFFWLRSRPRGIKPGDKAGCVTPHGYRYIKFLGRPYFAHRLAWFFVTGEWPLGWLDHINGDRQDNRYSNLREATTSENQQNRKMQTYSKSGMIGVRRSYGSRWRAMIIIDGRRIYLGAFATKDEAHAAYIKKKSEIHPFSQRHQL
jgi:hypothetical protein